VGVVYAKGDLFDTTPPWQGGGNMIADVTFEKTTYSPAPNRFEAGTGTIADAVGLGAALDYLMQVGIENVTRYEHDLLAYATAGLLTVPGIHIVGNAQEKAGVLSFVLDGLRTEDVGKALDEEGIAVRASPKGWRKRSIRCMGVSHRTGMLPMLPADTCGRGGSIPARWTQDTFGRRCAMWS
jgi:cysteine desulfurase / selenocysteine lyase